MIKGIQKTTLVDYPGKVACSLFTGGCNFRCGFCHNSDLVLKSAELPDIAESEIFDWLNEKRKYLDGVCITGGEPTLHKELPDLMRKIKQLGFLVKLDTNGTNPVMLKYLIDNSLVDYIAMDIKSSFENYPKTINAVVDIQKIKESIEILKSSNSFMSPEFSDSSKFSSFEYEFRTTVVPGIIDEDEILKIGKIISGAKRFCIQQFVPSENIVDEKLRDGEETSPEDLEKFRNLVLDCAEKVEIRNVS